MKQLALAGDWLARTTRLKGFLLRRRDLLPFIGGLIVSLTLQTADQLRERVKDAESSISSAQQFFRVQMLSETSILGVKTLQQRVEPLIEDSLRKTFSPNVDLTPIVDQLRVNIYELQNLDASVDNLASLTKLLSAADIGVLSSLTQIRETLSYLHYANREVQHALMAAGNGVVSKEQQSNVHPPPELDNLMTALNAKTFELQRKIDEFGLRVTSDAEQRRVRLEANYKRFLILSYFLYTFGMLLTLTGKMFGRKADDEVPE